MLKDNKKEVEWYFSLGINRPMEKYYIKYDSITFHPSLHLKK